MMLSIPRAIATAALGALAGAASLVFVFASRPSVTFDMDRSLPASASGFYPLERSGEETFVWTSDHASIAFAGFDRRVPWTCAVRFRGARPAAIEQPEFDLAIDGVRAGAWRATNEFQDVQVTVPALPDRLGLVLSVSSSAVFVPGPGDSRRLGVQVDRISCQPSSGVVLPPRSALRGAAGAAALLGAAFAFTGITAGSAVGGAVAMAVGTAFVLVGAGAPYGPYPAVAVRLAFWTGLALVLLAAGFRLARREPLRNTAKFVLTFSAGALYLQLLALLDPARPLVDALFHAHRFETVLAGRLYFTQLSTSATPFPYAIGLYLFAAPWAFVTANHVALLRIVAASVGIVAGGLLYAPVVRYWGNRLTGAIAVALYSLMPISYVIAGNANLTHAFGQAVSIVAVTVALMLSDRLRRLGPFVAVSALVTLGLISHVSTLLLLPGVLVAMAVLFWVSGGKVRRGAARRLLVVVAVALVASTAIYWGHFGDVYRGQWQRMRTTTAVAEGAGRAPASAAQKPALGKDTLPLPTRALQAAEQTVGAIGWPVFLLAFVGAWRAVADRARDRLTFTVAAWLAVFVSFVGGSVILPGGRTYQQDAWEFIARVIHATLPAAVLLAAHGAAWAWQAGRWRRLASAAALLAAVAVGMRAWAGWLF
jgi:hypothetical protein